MLDTVNTAKNIVIIGGSFISIEFAEKSKKNHDCNITIIYGGIQQTIIEIFW